MKFCLFSSKLQITLIKHRCTKDNKELINLVMMSVTGPLSAFTTLILFLTLDDTPFCLLRSPLPITRTDY